MSAGPPPLGRAVATVGGGEGGEPPRAEKRMREVQLVDAAHEPQVGRRDRLGLIVQARSAQTEQFTLAHDRHLTLRVNQRFALGRPNRPSAPAKKSRSMVSSPTLACRSRMRRSASSAAGLPCSKTSPARSSNCLRQVPIWLACTPWREDSSLKVASPCSASSAMRAFNFDEWFLRDCFMASAPFVWHRCRYNRAVHPLMQTQFRVQKSAATSENRAGRVSITVPESEDYIPAWSLEQVRK